MNAVELAELQFKKLANREEIDPWKLGLKASIPIAGPFYTPHEVASKTNSIAEGAGHMALTGLAAYGAGKLGGSAFKAPTVGLPNPLSILAGSVAGGTASGLTSVGLSKLHNARTRHIDKNESLLDKLKDAVANPTPINIPKTLIPYIGGLNVGAHTGDIRESATQGVAGTGGAFLGGALGLGTGVMNKPDYTNGISNKILRKGVDLANWGTKKSIKSEKWGNRIADYIFNSDNLFPEGKPSKLTRNIRRIPNGLIGLGLGVMAGGAGGTALAANNYNKKVERGDLDRSGSEKVEAILEALKNYMGHRKDDVSDLASNTIKNFR